MTDLEAGREAYARRHPKPASTTDTHIDTSNETGRAAYARRHGERGNRSRPPGGLGSSAT